jgi:ArsR family transcriptional regulator, arsenate/arsenite/antimonite-responsive transcriptional repressor
MDKKVFSPKELADLTRWLKIICEPNRLLLLEQIIEGVQCNCELGDALQLAPNLISHHLGVLRASGLVDVQRDPLDARWVYYSINQEAFEGLRILLDDFFNADRLQARRIGCGPQGLSFLREHTNTQET